MGKVAIDFKINNTHNNTGQLLIFIYLFITWCPLSLFTAASLIRLLPCRCSLSVFLTDHSSSCVFTILYFSPFFFSLCLFCWCISEIRPAVKKICPRALRPHVRRGRCSCVPARAAGCSQPVPSGLSGSGAGETVG